MKYAVVFESRTGNTAELAEHIKSLISPENLAFFGKPSAYAAQADLIFVGTWTDKGTCCDEIAGFLKGLSGKQIFIFGTAGFGGSPEYFNVITSRIVKNIPSGNIIKGSYFCQGKMPQSVRTRYEAIEKADPVKAKPMLDNFDKALSHPDKKDIENLEKAVLPFLNNI